MTWKRWIERWQMAMMTIKGKSVQSSFPEEWMDTTTSNALISCAGLGGYDWIDHADEGPTNYALMAYSSSRSDFEILVRQVNAAHSKTTVNAARPKSHFSKAAHSIVKRPIHKNITFKNINFNQRVNIVKDKNVNIVRPKAVVNAARPKAVVNAVQGNNINVVKASACWDKGVIDSGCSRHMTGNMSYLTDYEEIDGGYVAFGENPKGGKITGKGRESMHFRLGFAWIDVLEDAAEY
ncbi:hypothetical protein Tco_0458669 [Tanacetum coccineum]